MFRDVVDELKSLSIGAHGGYEDGDHAGVASLSVGQDLLHVTGDWLSRWNFAASEDVLISLISCLHRHHNIRLREAHQETRSKDHYFLADMRI